MIGIIIFSILTFVFLILLFVFIVKIIFGAMDKNKVKIKKSIVMTLLSLLFLIIFGIADSYFIIKTIYHNRKKIVEFTVESLDDVIKGSSQILSKSLRYTADDLWNNWDNEFVKQLNNIDLDIINYKTEIKNNIKTYAFEVQFDNKNESNSQIDYEKIFIKNYLTISNDNDIIYSIIDYKKNYEFNYIPKGKSKAVLIANIPNKEKLTYFRFGEKKYNINK